MILGLCFVRADNIAKGENIDSNVVLNGWVNSVRLHGQVIFIDLRDRYGKTQLVFDSDIYSMDFELIKKLSMEDVLSISGKVIIGSHLGAS